MAQEKPYCSVIVPVYNAGDDLARLLNALDQQTLPREQIEIVLVDNNSSDRSTAVQLAAASAQGARVLEETEHQSSYAARNRGVEASRASVLVFTDADTIPHPRWLEAGLRALDESSADLVGGHVVTRMNQPPALAELLDLCTWLDQQYYVQKQKFAVTANLFVRRKVFHAVGLFNPHLVSGGDAFFCRQAHADGFKLEYNAHAIVDHPSRRTLAEIKHKALRVGYGFGQLIALYRDEQPPFLNPRKYVLAAPRFSRLRQLNIPLPLSRLLLLWVLNYAVIRRAYAIGSYRGYRAASAASSDTPGV